MGWKNKAIGIVGIAISLSAMGSEGWVSPSELQDERISFYDLSPTSRISPFKSLKEYTGEPSRIEDFQGLVAYHQSLLKAQQPEIPPTPLSRPSGAADKPTESIVSIGTHETNLSVETTGNPAKAGDC